MVVKEIRELLPEEAVVFDNPAFDLSIIGSTTEGGAVYDYNSMVKELMVDDDMSEEDAIDFINYKTIRSIGCANSFGVPPTVIHSLENEIIEATCNVEI